MPRPASPRHEAPRVAVVGALNVDLVVRVPALPAPGETVLGGDLARHGGGKGANAAVAAARAGAVVRLVAAAGDDDLGREALEELRADGVDARWVERRADAPTGAAVILVDPAGENQIAVAPGANLRLTPAWVAAALGELTPGAVCLVSLEIAQDAVRAALGTAAARGLVVVVDPAPPERTPRDALAGVILTPNRGEALRLTGEPDPEGAARALAERTGAPAIVTLGAEGAVLAHGGRTERVRAPAVRAVDATGAGDAFSGTLAARLAAGDALPEATARAVEAGSRSVETAGARAPRAHQR